MGRGLIVHLLFINSIAVYRHNKKLKIKMYFLKYLDKVKMDFSFENSIKHKLVNSIMLELDIGIQ